MALLFLLVLPGFLFSTQTHKVQKGETLTDIAKRYGISVDEVKKANELKTSNTIFVGQELAIPSVPREHKVSKGQNLSDIAKRYGVSVDDLVRWNGLSSKNSINAGQLLKVSKPDGVTQAEDHPVYHIVKKGETLGSIAEEHGMKLTSLAGLNGIKKPYTIYVGQRLTVNPSDLAMKTPVSETNEKQPEETIRILVRKNETLGSIADRYGVSERSLADYNGIKNPNLIRIGQRLIIPGSSANPKKQLPSSIEDKLDRTSVRSGRWKYLVVHHTAAPNSTVKGMEYYHRKVRRMENGLAYHFIIGNGKAGDLKDGEIYIGARWTKQLDGGHLAKQSLNAKSLGICLVGNFEVSRPSAAQMKSLNALVDYLLARCRLKSSAVKTHTLIHRRHTACPGKYFPTSSFLAEVKKRN